ncbi:hypothetical protein BASA60_002338 [Batrachochytrium salamandrivorans]|nr:hypothetical protein BASA60_002338 [Batrachochytrium salamandrivorans]
MTLLTPTKTSLSEFYTAAAYSNTGLLLSPRSSRFCRTAKASAAACSPSAAFGGTSHRLSGPRHVSASISASVSASVSASISASVAGRCSTPYKAESAPVTAEDRSDHVDIKTRHPPSSPASSDVSLAAVTTPTKGNSGLRKECNLNRGSSATDNIPASHGCIYFHADCLWLSHVAVSAADGSDSQTSLAQRWTRCHIGLFTASIAQPSPGVRRSKSKITTYDRFIPNRDAMDSASSHFAGIKEPLDRQKPLDAEAIAYQEQLARACGVAIDQRILAYNVEPPGVERQDLRTTWNRPLRAPNVKLAKRRIPTMADKVLGRPWVD